MFVDPDIKGRYLAERWTRGEWEKGCACGFKAKKLFPGRMLN